MKLKLVITCIVMTVLVAGFTTHLLAGNSTPASRSVNNKVVLQNYNTELKRLNHQIGSQQRIAAKHPLSWVHQEKLAIVLLERARLSGNTDDYLKSQMVIQRAFEIADGNGGPFLTRAALNYSMHRLPEIEADLVAAESALLVDNQTKTSIAGLRADVKFNSGLYSEAKYYYDKSELKNPSTETAIRQAFYAVSTADYEAAESWFVKAGKRSINGSNQLRAWLKLQLGILKLEQGQWDEARRYYVDAQVIFPYHWLIEEHIAEIEVLLGDDQKPEQSYRDLIKRTKSPLFMDALASILHTRDSDKEITEARLWNQRTNKAFKLSMESAPELISGHALDYFLQSDEMSLALTLAKQNYQLRPAGPAAVTLAQAFALQGQYTQSLALLEDVLAGPYRSPNLHATAYAIYQQLDRSLEATEQLGLANHLSSVAIDDIDWFKKRLSALPLSSID